MRHVDFDPSRLRGEDATKWKHWLTKAEAERQRVLKEKALGRQPSFDPAILPELKGWLLKNVFHNKCALCEYNVVPPDYGEFEHYRPVSEVTEAPSHPGYYWVAYDWRNLLPLCARCGGPNGKGNRFPIEAHRVSDPKKGPDPDVLDEVEVPQLLNPYKDYPAKHLKFGVKGAVAAISGKGRTSIEVYGLKGRKGDPFFIAMQEQQEKAWHFLEAAIEQSVRQARPIGELLERYIGPNARFSQAVCDYLNIKLDDIPGTRQSQRDCG